MKQSNNQTLVKIPFSGFYNSIHDKAFETILNNLPECLYDELSKLEIDNP